VAIRLDVADVAISIIDLQAEVVVRDVDVLCAQTGSVYGGHFQCANDVFKYLTS
jgi:hypothetical protein